MCRLASGTEDEVYLMASQSCLPSTSVGANVPLQPWRLRIDSRASQFSGSDETTAI